MGLLNSVLGLLGRFGKSNREAQGLRAQHGTALAGVALFGVLGLLPLGLAAAPGSAAGKGLQAQQTPAVAKRTPGDLLLIAERLHLGNGQVLTPGAVWVQAGRIAAVGAPTEVELAAQGSGATRRQVVEATPGLIDARSCLGLAGWLNIEHDKDELDRSEPLQPELRAIDAFNPEDPLLAWVRGFGVTTVHTGHAPRALIAGQTMVIKTDPGSTWEQALLVPNAMLVVTLGEQGLGEKSPGTRAKALAMLRQALLDAARYAEQRSAPDESKWPNFNLRHESLAAALRGEVGFLVFAHRRQDIQAALRLDQEFPGLKLVLDGAAELTQTLDEFQRSPVPVILHPSMARPGGETAALSMASAGRLAAAGIPFALQSGYEDYVPRTRVVLFEAAVAARHGLEREAALRAITLDAAKLLGVDARVGSLEVGKDGDLALYDGDPFETTTHCLGTYIEGRLVSDGERR